MPHALPNHRAARIVLSALFCAALALPGLLAWIAPPPAASLEREFRRPAPKPQTPQSLESALAWPRAFDAWFSDHYGLRVAYVNALYDGQQSNALLWSLGHGVQSRLK